LVITAQDKRTIKKVNTRRARGVRWEDIARELGHGSPGALLSWLDTRAVKVNNAYIPKDRVERLLSEATL